MDREALTAVRDALKAVQSAEAFLDKYRPALVQIGPLMAVMGEIAREHRSAVLDLRINRLRLQSMLPAEPPDPEREDPDKTPVDGARRLSQQLAATRPTPKPDAPKKGT